MNKSDPHTPPLSHAGARCTDAAGVERKLLVWAEPEWDAQSVAALDAVLARAGNATKAAAWRVLLAYAVLVLIAALLVVAMPREFGSIAGAVLLAVGAVGGWVYARHGLDRRGGWDRRVRDEWIVQRRCPSCAYPLNAELASGQAGQLRCSECGGLWALPRGEER